MAHILYALMNLKHMKQIKDRLRTFLSLFIPSVLVLLLLLVAYPQAFLPAVCGAFAYSVIFALTEKL